MICYRLKNSVKYDYLLIVGPGRSGSTFMYQKLKAHPDIEFSGIKEGYLYRSLERFKQARKRLDKRLILADISNLGYQDPLLSCGIKMIKNNGYRILLILSIREHFDRAVSMVRFKRSRGEFCALRGMDYLEKKVMDDQLMPEHLLNIFDVGVDILIVYFPVLTQKTEMFLEHLSSLCGISQFDNIKKERVNESVCARNILLSAFGKVVAITLRKLRCVRFLQTLKDSNLMRRLFFMKLRGDDFSLSERNKRLLSALYFDCCSIVDDFSHPIAEQIYFRKAGTSLPESADWQYEKERH